MRKNQAKKITLSCSHCKKEFERRLCEHVRNEKLGRKIFCSLSCRAVAMPQTAGRFGGDIDRMGEKRNYGIYPSDELSPFRWHLKVARQRKRWENTLSLEHLRDIWVKQNGRCPYLNIELKLPKDTGENCDSLNFASLDRIDSSKGYVEGNVEFVCVFINYAKNKFSKQDVESILKQFKQAT